MTMPTDTELMDFLADPKQTIASVMLPESIVVRNVDSLRAAIAEAMEQWKLSESLKDVPDA